MRDVARSDSLRGGLSQLKRFFSKAPFLVKGGFSSFIFVSAGFLGIFPALPPIDQNEIIAIKEQTEDRELVVQKKSANTDEICLWQKDVSLFNSLEDEKRITLEKEAPCREALEKVALPQTAKIQNEDVQAKILEMAAGYPIEVMAATISEYDREVAALIVGIAKKESNWGKRVPRSPDGADCFNYWGFKGAGTRGVAMGHGCFGSPEEAVHAVGKRLAQLVEIRKTSEPKNMVIWKCGSSCATHSPESVSKWISDVDLYYRKIANN